MRRLTILGGCALALLLAPAAHAGTSDDHAKKLRLSPVRGVERESLIFAGRKEATLRVIAARDGSQMLMHMNGIGHDGIRMLYRKRGDVLAIQGIPPHRKRWYVLGARRYARSIERLAKAHLRAAEAVSPPPDLVGDQVYSFDAKPIYERLIAGSPGAQPTGEPAAAVRGYVRPGEHDALEVVSQFLSATDQEILEVTTIVGAERDVPNLKREAEYEVGYDPDVRLAPAPASSARAAQSQDESSWSGYLYKMVQAGLESLGVDAFARRMSPRWGPTVAGSAVGAGLMAATNLWLLDRWTTFYNRQLDILSRSEETPPRSRRDRSAEPGTGFSIPRLAPASQLTPPRLGDPSGLSAPELTPLWLVPPCPPDLGPMPRLGCAIMRAAGLPWPP